MARAFSVEGWSLGSKADWRTAVIGIGAAALVAADLVVGGTHLAGLTIGTAVVLIGVAAAIRWPGLAFGAIVVMVPLQLAVLAYLYRLGAPAPVVRYLGYIKDGATVGITIGAMRATVSDSDRRRKNLDWLDWFALLYIGIAVAYLLIPVLVPGSLGGQSLSVRINAWRLDCLFIVLMLAMRRTELSGQSIRRVLTALFVVAGVLCGFGIWEKVSSGGFNNFMVNTIRLPEYQLNILHVLPPVGYDYVNRGPIGGSNILRVGSLLADTLALGFYMVIPLAYGIERVRSSARLIPIIGMLSGGITVVLANTRSAILAGAIVVVLSFWLAFRERSRFRIRMVVVGLAAAALLAPFALHSGVRHRFDQAFGSSQTSDETGHVTASSSGISDVVHHPAGFGLGANPATGGRNSTSNHVDTENSYLTVASELGDGAMLAFVGMYIAMLTALSRNRRQPGEIGRLASAGWLAGCGFLIGGLFLPIWLNFPTTLTFWGLAGLACRHRPPGGAEVQNRADGADLEPAELELLDA